MVKQKCKTFDMKNSKKIFFEEVRYELQRRDRMIVDIVLPLIVVLVLYVLNQYFITQFGHFVMALLSVDFMVASGLHYIKRKKECSFSNLIAISFGSFASQMMVMTPTFLLLLFLMRPISIVEILVPFVYIILGALFSVKFGVFIAHHIRKKFAFYSTTLVLMILMALFSNTIIASGYFGSYLRNLILYNPMSYVADGINNVFFNYSYFGPWISILVLVLMNAIVLLLFFSMSIKKK